MIILPGSTYFNISASIPNVVNQYEGCKDFRSAHEIFAFLTTQLCTRMPSYNPLLKQPTDVSIICCKVISSGWYQLHFISIDFKQFECEECKGFENCSRDCTLARLPRNRHELGPSLPCPAGPKLPTPVWQKQR